MQMPFVLCSSEQTTVPMPFGISTRLNPWKHVCIYTKEASKLQKSLLFGYTNFP